MTEKSFGKSHASRRMYIFCRLLKQSGPNGALFLGFQSPTRNLWFCHVAVLSAVRRFIHSCGQYTYYCYSYSYYLRIPTYLKQSKKSIKALLKQLYLIYQQHGVCGESIETLYQVHFKCLYYFYYLIVYRHAANRAWTYTLLANFALLQYGAWNFAIVKE